MSPVVDATDPETRATAIEQAVDAVRAGELVVLPTDTVYGIGCDAFDPVAVTALLAAKGRGRDVPPPVLIGQVRTLDGIADDIQPYVRDLVERFWPGALTIVVTAQPSLHWDLGDTEGTVAVRMPDDEIALALLAETGPMAVTSANLHGRPAATTVLDAATQLGAAVGVYLDGGQRNTQQPSTILDCTGPAPIVLRAGAIGEDDLAAVTALHTDEPDLKTDERGLATDEPGLATDEPGMAPDEPDLESEQRSPEPDDEPQPAPESGDEPDIEPAPGPELDVPAPGPDRDGPRVADADDIDPRSAP